MNVVDFKTGEPLTKEEFETRVLAAAPETAARQAIRDAFVLLHGLRIEEWADKRTLDNAVMALKFACNSNGLHGEELALNMKPIGPSVA